MRSDWLLPALSEEERRELLSHARRRRFTRGQVIFHEDDPGDTLHLIAKGHVAVRITTELGDTLTFTVLGPGDCVGELSILAEGSRRTATVSALDPVETVSLQRQQVLELRNANAAVDRVLVDVLANQVRRLSEHLVEALHVPVERRVVRRLEALCELFSSTGTPGTCVVPITQDDLADLAGTTRPTTNRVLKTLEADGVVALRRGRLEVVDLEELRRRGR